MAGYTFGYTNGGNDVATVITTDADLALGKEQKHGIAAITLSAASKTVTAGLGEDSICTSSTRAALTPSR